MALGSPPSSVAAVVSTRVWHANWFAVTPSPKIPEEPRRRALRCQGSREGRLEPQ
jgi:hypothetical protein